MDEKKAVTKRTPAPKPTDAGALVRLALEKDIDIERLQKLIDMKNREEEREAKREFDLHFAEMQQELGTVIRSKIAKGRNGEELYSYAPLEAILKVAGPVLAKHGFAYRFPEETLPNGEKRVWCVIAGYGHEERNYVDIPIAAATSFTNAVQQRGVAATYGKRYAFIGATGIVIDDDNDTQDLPSTEYQVLIDELATAPDLDALKNAFTASYKALEGDDTGRKILITAKDKRKRELMQTPEETPKTRTPPTKAEKEKAGKAAVIGKIGKLAEQVEDAEVIEQPPADPVEPELEIF